MKGKGSREASLARAPRKAASKTHTRDFAISPHSSQVTRHIAAIHMNGQCHGWPSALTSQMHPLRYEPCGLGQNVGT